MNTTTRFSVSIFALLICLSYSLKATEEKDYDWIIAGEILKRIHAPVFQPKDYLITDFGAVGDGEKKNTEAINQAILTCHENGGGRVVVPSGKFLTGAIHLKSNVNLYLDEGAILLFSTGSADYLPQVFTRWEGVECKNYSPFIYAFEEENIAITGSGTLDGQSNESNWWIWKGLVEYGWKKGLPSQEKARDRLFEMGEKGIPVSQRVFGEGDYLRPQFIQPYRCRNVLIEGVKIINSPMWEINPVLCRNVIVRGVHIFTHGPNNDGCNPESCQDVLIENCHFDTGDDCIAIKSGRNNDGRRVGIASENIYIRNCFMKDGHGGVVIGSEISGGCRNVFVENCKMDSPHLERALRIKTNSIRGGLIENVYFRDVEVGQVSYEVLRINFEYEEGDAGDFMPVVKNIHMENVNVGKAPRALRISGYEHSPIRDVYLTNCAIKNIGQASIIEHVQNLCFSGTTLSPSK